MRIINRAPSKGIAIALAALPFALAIAAYAVASAARLAANPADKLLPSFARMVETFLTLATVPDRRTGDIILWIDTAASLQRLGVGIALAALLALLFGVLIGFMPYARATLAPFVSTISLIPPITVLPILFISFGLGEASKIALIVVGTAPVMIRSISQAVLDIPRELVIKAQTLGASSWQIVTRLVLPHSLPQLITAIRLGLVPGWIFLISAEAIASTDGLGYRIFLVRRYLAMDVILPYVVWIALLAFLIDRALLMVSRRMFRWHHMTGDAL